MKPRIFRSKCGTGQWILLVPQRIVGKGNVEPTNAEFIDITTYRNFLRAFNKGWRVRSVA